MKGKVYSESHREKILEAASDPVNKMRGMTEATGMLILDGIYMIIEMLHGSESVTEQKINLHQE